MIGPLEVLEDVVTRFEKIGIDYFLVGSLAAMYYSRPRFTNDIHLVVQLSAIKVSEFEKQFPLEEYYCPPPEVIRRGSFNLVHQASGIKIDLVLNKMNEFYQSEFKRRKKVNLTPQFSAYIASPEDVILKKLDFYKEGLSEKHLADIREILISSNIDLSYLETWVQKLHLSEAWELAQS